MVGHGGSVTQHRPRRKVGQQGPTFVGAAAPRTRTTAKRTLGVRWPSATLRLPRYRVTTIEQEIATWASSRPPWQQAVLRQLAQGQSLSGNEVQAIADELKAGRQSAASPLTAAEIPGALPAGNQVVLRSVRDLSNVNALLDSQQLTFADQGLTVVYGDNGSGKSGYARIIKSAAGARHHEAVHGNVFGQAVGQTQKASIGFATGGVDTTATWPDPTSPELRAISFYDEACGDAYIGGDSELTYRPSALLILDGLIEVCDSVSAILAEDLRENELSRGPLPPVAAGTSAAGFLSTLSGTTTDAELDAACSVPADGDEQLGRLVQEEARLRATDPARERTRLETFAGKLSQVSVHARQVASGLSDESVMEAKQAFKQATELRAAATLASSGAFDNEPVRGVGTGTWRTLWDSARAYSEAEAYPDSAFPVASEGACCVLCQQTLPIEAGDRLQRFQAFMQDTTAQRADAAEALLDQKRAAVQMLEAMPPVIAGLLVEVEAGDSLLAQQVTTWLEAADGRRTAVLSQLDGAPVLDVPPLDASPVAALDARVTELRTTAMGIDSTNFQDTLAGMVTSKNDLEARRLLSAQRTAISAEISRLATRAMLEDAKRLTDTTGITRKSTDLAEAYVTSLVRDRFTRESDRLQLERVELKKKGGAKGKVRHRPALLGANQPKPVEEVLSEGEQTALGLAGYFTEAHFDASKSGLVLDDPVTSLDHVRRSHVARRLAQLATDRQVVVFTHDVAFVGDLRRAAEDEQVGFTERGIQRRGGKTPGLCTDQHPWKAKDVGARFHELEQLLARIKRERDSWDQEHYEKECADWGGKLSETWERLINLEIVNSVVDKGTSEVKPRMFKVLARITGDDDREFQQSYARCSEWTRRHDKSPATNYVAPEPAALEAELSLVRGWYDRVRGYKN